MKMNFVKSVLICLVFTFSFTLITAAQTQQFKTSSLIKENSRIIKSKREIIKLLLADFFKNISIREIYLSTKNIPAEIQKEFPAIENLNTKFLSANSTMQESKCLFEFRIFSVSRKKASVLFGDCNDGLGYNFKKSAGKWKIVPNEITKDIPE